VQWPFEALEIDRSAQLGAGKTGMAKSSDILGFLVGVTPAPASGSSRCCGAVFHAPRMQAGFSRPPLGQAARREDREQSGLLIRKSGQ
jgi:hypothetical protein